MAAGSAEAGGAKTVQVRGYTKKDGTVVRAHARSAPGSGRGTGVVLDAPPIRTEPRTEARKDPPTVAVVVVIPEKGSGAAVLPSDPVFVTLTPPKGEAIMLGVSAYSAATAAKESEVWPQWERTGQLRRLTEATEVELVEPDWKFSKVRLGGKVWYVETKWLPAEEK